MTVQTPKAASQAPGAHSEPSSGQAQAMPPQAVACSHPPAFQPTLHVCSHSRKPGRAAVSVSPRVVQTASNCHRISILIQNFVTHKTEAQASYLRWTHSWHGAAM